MPMARRPLLRRDERAARSAERVEDDVTGLRTELDQHPHERDGLLGRVQGLSML